MFTILAADQGSATGEGGDVFSADSSILKNVRGVTAVQDYLDK